MTDYPTYLEAVHAALVAGGCGVSAADALCKLHRARVEVGHFHNRDAAEMANELRRTVDPEYTPIETIRTFMGVL